MNIIKFYYACFEQQKRCCYNVAPSLACIKSKQSGEYTVLTRLNDVELIVHCNNLWANLVQALYHALWLVYA